MKANRTFLKGDDAVSPVIAVILMVAITVVLAATVYVWVSGFGASSNQPAKSLALSSAGPVSQVDIWHTANGAAGADTTNDFYRKTYVVSSASPGMKYQDITLTANGATLAFESTNCAPTAADPAGTTGNKWSACGAGARLATDVIAAGDRIVLQHNAALGGQTLRILDPQSNSVILTLVMG